jgi:glycosyltransferase involved in cell wall biosynthesis
MISVVIPAYKARRYLPDCLDSIERQTLPPCEVLVIDDCSPEPIDDIIALYAGRFEYPIRLIRHGCNQGLGATRNTGIHQSQGEWIAFLDHDDVWAPDHLRNLSLCAEQTGADIAYSSVKQFAESLHDAMPTWGPDESDLGTSFTRRLFEKSFITPSATLIRKEKLLAVNGFNTDPRVHMCEDLDLWMRMIQSRCCFSHSSEVSCYYRKHPESATGRPAYMAYQAAYVREIHLATIPGSHVKKYSIIARHWWRAYLLLESTDPRCPSAMSRSLFWSIFAPWEFARGLIHLRRKSRSTRVGER